MSEPQISRPALAPDLMCLVLGLGSLLWLPASLWPDAGLPAWPSVSSGLVALALAWFPGRPMARGVGAFAAFVGTLVGSLQIAALWGLVGGLSG